MVTKSRLHDAPVSEYHSNQGRIHVIRKAPHLNKHLHLSQDPVMAGLITRFGKLRVPAAQREPYEALCESIIYQQLHAKAAATIFGRLVARIGNGVLPTPDAMLDAPDEALRAAGLSRNKIAALLDLARHLRDGRLPALSDCRALDDEALIARLSDIRGIGRWTVEMFLIFTLGRPDVLPAGDFGVRRGYAIAYSQPEMPAPKALALAGERWAPHRSLAALYLWRVADGGKAWKA
jgi:DNA-3-methyladenine glycosylase II